MTNVLVTGIDGFVGSHLAEAVLAHPAYRVFGLVLDRSVSSRLDRLKPHIQLLEADIVDREQVRHALSICKPARIYHLAGQAFVPLAMKDPLSTFNTNIDGGINVLESVRQEHLDCSVLVVSSGEVYGAVDPAQLPITERCAVNPNNPYAASKACIDIIAQQYRNSFKMEVVVARPFNHIGPGQSELFVSSAFAKQIIEIKAGVREPKLHVGNLAPKRDFTDVRDVVQAYILLLEESLEFGVFNVCSGNSIPIRRILDTLLEIAGVTAEIVLDPERQRADDVPEIVGSPARLQSATGWHPNITLGKTLNDLLVYWEEQIRAKA